MEAEISALNISNLSRCILHRLPLSLHVPVHNPYLDNCSHHPRKIDQDVFGHNSLFHGNQLLQFHHHIHRCWTSHYIQHFQQGCCHNPVATDNRELQLKGNSTVV